MERLRLYQQRSTVARIIRERKANIYWAKLGEEPGGEENQRTYYPCDARCSRHPKPPWLGCCWLLLRRPDLVTESWPRCTPVAVATISHTATGLRSVSQCKFESHDFFLYSPALWSQSTAPGRCLAEGRRTGRCLFS